MIEVNELLVNYGVLGLWTITLLFDKINFQKQMKEIIIRNTQALIEIKEVMNKCRRK